MLPAALAICCCLAAALTSRAAENVMLTDVPDYSWHAGCFGTAAGNLMGYWDRHGFSDFYTGPTAGGVAPLNNVGFNIGIQSLWASKAGTDGRPYDRLGHVDDYWVRYNHELDLSYESTEPDPYLTAGRPEHQPDCISDFIGASQNRWQNLNGECDGNIDAYAFVFWDATGARRVNFVPPPQGDVPVLDIPSGLRAWTQHRGYDCTVFSQLVDFNPTVPAGQGFTFEGIKAEINAGYPVMLFLQNYNEMSRSLLGLPRANPNVHGMLAYGYYVSDTGTRYVRYKTSWGGSGDNRMRTWNAFEWEAFLPVRGIIGYRPLPRITGIMRRENTLDIKWDGPSSTLTNMVTGSSTALHKYVVEQSTRIDPTQFTPVSEPSTAREVSLTNCCEGAAFFRIRLLPP